MLIANDEENNKIIAHSSLKGKFATCPFCEKKVLCKSGSIRIPHFAHLAGECEHAKEGETEWHLNWKKRLMQEGHKIETKIYDITCEYFKRADVITKNEIVIEFQNSPISLFELSDRNYFYCNNDVGLNGIIWVFNYINKSHKIVNYKKFKINYLEKHISYLKKINCLFYLDLGLDKGMIEYAPSNLNHYGYLISHQQFIKKMNFISKSKFCYEKAFEENTDVEEIKQKNIEFEKNNRLYFVCTKCGNRKQMTVKEYINLYGNKHEKLILKTNCEHLYDKFNGYLVCNKCYQIMGSLYMQAKPNNKN